MPNPDSRSASRTAGGKCRVMVVDDSAVIRGFFRRALEADPGLEVVASVGNGQAAIDSLKRNPVDVIVLDIEMPVMDGMTAIPKLLEVDPDVRIVMASTLTLANAEISMKALSIGATDYIPKPTTSADIHSSEWFGRELVEKVTGLGKSARGKKTKSAAVKPAPEQHGSALYSDPITLRRAAVLPAQVVAIGSSTGGPQALMKVLEQLGSDFPNPILITQHMPATFTGILAEHVAKAAGIPAAEAKDGEPVKPNRIYIAPGDWHMTVEATDHGPVIRLNQNPPENFCRPAVDVMLRGMAEVYGDRLLVVIMTGMGRDGLDGARAIIEQGGTMIAQDEQSSVVWGMPGAVATAGLCSAVIPLDQIAAKIRSISGKAAA